jgi:hypothetical protein
VSENAAWFSVSPASGSNNGTVTVTYQENTSTQPRSATITISGNGASNQTVTVTQEGMMTAVKDAEVVGISIFPNPISNALNIEIPENMEVSEIYVVNMAGVKIARAQNPNNQMTIDFSSFVPGVYVLYLKAGDDWFKKKLMKVN